MRFVLPARSRTAVFVAVVAFLAMAISAAFAAPQVRAAAPGVTWDLAQLQTDLATHGGAVQGYFLTVLGGSTEADQQPQVIPATIKSIVPNATQDGSLILFAGTGPAMSAIGGIAAGMSGSPLYVGDPADPHTGTDPLLGAVSYGDEFTTGGLGLATPIGYMTAIEDKYLSSAGLRAGAVSRASATGAATAATGRTAKLRHALHVGGRTITRVAVVATRAKARAAAARPGTAAFTPLATLEIGGLSPESHLYKTMATAMQAAGYRVVPAPAGGATSGFDPGWSTPLTGGSSVGTPFARGDFWVGSAGTVTYVNGAKVLAYGHPLGWLGSTDIYLTNAWVSGVWADTLEPYKLMEITALQGRLVQDRNSGIAGIIGAAPVDTPVTASVTVNGGAPVRSTSYVPRSVASSNQFADVFGWGYALPATAVLAPVEKALDAMVFAGSATTTSTVVVSDGALDYTLTLNNRWDDTPDVSMEVADDLNNALLTLNANADGTAPATIKSVDFTADFSSAHHSARIVSASVPGGLKTGDNDVVVTLAEYGVQALQTRHLTLKIPEDAASGGSLEVYGGGSYLAEGGTSFTTISSSARRSSSAARSTSSDDRMSVADLVDELQNQSTNADLVVDYVTGSDSDSDSSSAAIESKLRTTLVVTGDLQLQSDPLQLRATPRAVRRRHGAVIAGTIAALTDPDTSVRLYRGSSTKPLATVRVVRDGDGGGLFTYALKHIKATTRVTAVWDGDSRHLGATGRTTVRVKRTRHH
jgi:hypothetical protein